MRYAYIGLGNLGANLAACLLRGGFSVVVHDRDPHPAQRLLALGATWAATPREAAAQVDAVLTCLPSPAVTEAVLTGPDGILAGLRDGGAWIEMSTVDRDTILRLSALAAARGVRTLEAPVTGGVHLSPPARSPCWPAATPTCSKRTGRRWSGWATASCTWGRSAVRR